MAYNSNDIPKLPENMVALVVSHGATMKLEWVSVEAAHNAKAGPLFSFAPQRTWIGLTDDEMWNAYAGGSDIINLDYAKAIEAKLKEKNT